MRENKPQIRWNAETRKAILMGDDYDTYKTLVQFYHQEKKVLENRRARATQAVKDFAMNGGSIEYDEESMTCYVAMGDSSYTVEYDEEGGIRRYTVENPAGDPDDILYMHWMFYCSIMLERLDSAIEQANIKLQHLENDVLIKSLSKTAGTISDDVYLTAGAVAGLDLRTDDDVDPLGIWSDQR